MLSHYVILFVCIYFLMLLCILLSSKKSSGRDDFLFSNSSVNSILSFFGIFATVFSAYTLQGLPSFARAHGIGVILFLLVPITVMWPVFMFFGLRIRRYIEKFKLQGRNISSLILEIRKSKVVCFFYLIGLTLFLLPYLVIQIKGISHLISLILPIFSVDFNFLIWSIIIFSSIYFYSYFGGIKVIYKTDVIQGMIMAIVVCVISTVIFIRSDGLSQLFIDIRSVNPDLLTLPGGRGVITIPFLLLTFGWAMFYPFLQPQVFTRLLIIKDNMTFLRTFLYLPMMSILIYLPIIFIGLKGVLYQDVGLGGFLIHLLSSEVGNVLAALYIVSIFAASMSTMDSLLFALGTEWGSLFASKVKGINTVYVKLYSLVIGLLALIFSQFEIQSLIILSSKSFSGVSMLSPIFFSIFLGKKMSNTFAIATSSIFAVLFLFKSFHIINLDFFSLPYEIWVYILIGLYFIIWKCNSYLSKRRTASFTVLA